MVQTTQPSTQRYLPFTEIKDDCLILKDGTLAAVIMTSSVNFALKSEEEQEALVSSYVSFLNSISFMVQIVVQSRPMRIQTYIDALSKQEAKTKNELLRLQLREYKEFVRELVSLGDIMSKKFYVIVPYAPGREKYRSFTERLSDFFSVGRSIAMSRDRFEKYKQELEKRCYQINSSLGGLGLSAVRLDTKGLIELFYNVYNPVTSYQQEIKDLAQIQVEEDATLIK